MAANKTAIRKVARKHGARAQRASLKSHTISGDFTLIEGETWLLQPVAVTMMRHGYSLIQMRILVPIAESLRSILHDILNDRQGFRLDLFRINELNEDERMPIKLPFKELGVDPDHYPQLRNPLRMLAFILVGIPYRTAEGRKCTKATNPCDVYIPEDRSYNKYAILKPGHGVAERLISLDFGYHRLGEQITFACKSRYTQCIHMFIEPWVDKGRIVVKILEFREMLRSENNYKKSSDFCRRVLDPAVQELKEFVEKGFCDCHSEHEKKYDHDQRGGRSDELTLIIRRIKGRMNVQLQEVTQNQRRRFQQYLVQYFDFTSVNARTMADRITAEAYQGIIQKPMGLCDHFVKTFVKNKTVYTFKSLGEMSKSKEVPNAIIEEVE